MKNLPVRNSYLLISVMKQYLDILKKTLNEGTDRIDRTGVGTRAIFGTSTRYNLADGKFPLLTTKKLFTRGIIEELLWFISGSTNAKDLQAKNVHIWDEWAGPDGELGPVYGKQWRSWTMPDGSGKDQLMEVINDIKQNPTSRRLIVSSWNVGEIPDMALPPCHCFYQFFVRREYLDLQLYQRSCDIFLGMPFNIASYSLLLMMVAQVTGLKPGEFIHTTGDTHLYSNHFEQAKLQLTREPRELPTMTINPEVTDITKFTVTDFVLSDYNPWPTIKAPIAV